MDRLQRWRHRRDPFAVLVTLPTSLVFGLCALALALVWVDRTAGDTIGAIIPVRLDPATSTALLTTVATGAMAALTLTYSLVLVVYTLAAGTIAPRLLKRFTTDPWNHLTASLFGGTFLYSVIVIWGSDPEQVPLLSDTVAVVLAVTCVVQLIAFVRHVSGAVTIDDEVARIGDRLTRALEERVAHDRDDATTPTDDLPAAEEFETVVSAPRSGYLGDIDAEAMVRRAQSADTVLRLDVEPGEFVLEGESLVSARHGTECGDLDELITIEKARSTDRPIEFHTNLLVEMALRALSPAINDTYTGRACANELSSSLAVIATAEMDDDDHHDDEGTVRLLTPGMELERLVGLAFHPLRQASATNVLMAETLARCYARLYSVGNEDMRAEMERHAVLLLAELRRGEILPADVDRVLRALPEALRREAVEEDAGRSPDARRTGPAARRSG